MVWFSLVGFDILWLVLVWFGWFSFGLDWLSTDWFGLGEFGFLICFFLYAMVVLIEFGLVW